MYCKYCGIENESTAEICQLCKRPFIAQDTQPSQIVYLDFALFPFADIWKNTLRSANILNIIFFPILSLIYFYHKLIRKPFWIPLRNSLQSQLKIVNLKSSPPALGNKVPYSDNELLKLGFTYELTFTDIGSRGSHYQSFYINTTSGAYAMQYIDKNTNKLLYTSFLAITEKRRIFIYANTFGLSMEHSQIIMQYCSDKSITQLRDIFMATVQQSGEHLLCPELKDIMPILFQLDIKQHEIGASMNRIKIAASPINSFSAWSCHNHPQSLAVRKCPTCGQVLCEACINECDGTYYCKTCLPENVGLQEVMKPWNYAGLALRTVASSIDLIITLLLAAVIFSISQYLLQHFFVVQSSLFALLITQVPLLASVYYNNIYRVARSGQSIGKKICGVLVLDKQGKAPGFVAAFNRLTIKFCSAIFVIPYLAYFLVPFTKKKKCFIDTLSGTVVLTKHSLKATIVSWIIFLLLGAGTIGTILIIYFATFHPVGSSITINPVWEKKGMSYDQFPGFQQRMHDPFFLYCKDDTVYSVSKSTGTATWKTAFDGTPTLYYNDTAYIFVITSQYQSNARLHRLDNLNGAILWSTPLPDSGACSINSYDSTIIVNSTRTIMSIRPDGTVRWKNSIAENTMPESSSDSSAYYDEEDYDEQSLDVSIDMINNRIFVYVPKANASYSYDYLTGTRSITQDVYESLPVRVNDSVYYIRQNTQLRFYSKTTNQQLFELQDSTYSIEIPEENDTIFYCTNAAIAATNGDTIFTYADSFYLNDLAGDYLLLGKVDTSVSPLNNVPKYTHLFIVVDRFTNRMIATISDSAVTTLNYSYQDDTLLYFFTIANPWEVDNARKFSFFRLFLNNFKERQSSIITINKVNGAIDKIVIGSNVYWVQLFRSDNRLLFFTNISNVTGAYDLSTPFPAGSATTSMRHP